jgi:hypothetical protein
MIKIDEKLPVRNVLICVLSGLQRQQQLFPSAAFLALNSSVLLHDMNLIFLYICVCVCVYFFYHPITGHQGPRGGVEV